MALTRLEHFLVISDDIEATRRFYCDVLGMTVGFRPELDFDGYWLYAGDTPCIHVAERESYARYTERIGIPMSQGTGSGRVDHVAFNATGFEETLARLERHGLDARRNILDDIGLRQIFVHDPSGVKVELNFRSPPAT